MNARLVKATEDKRQSIIDLGNSFITKGFVKHVCDNHKFKDDKLYYVCLIEDDNAIENYNTLANLKQKTVEYNDANEDNDGDEDENKYNDIITMTIVSIQIGLDHYSFILSARI